MTSPVRYCSTISEATGQAQLESGDASHLSAYDLNYAQTEISEGKGVFAFKHVFAWLLVSIEPGQTETLTELVASAANGIANEGKINAITGEISAVPASADEKMVLKINGGEGVKMNRGNSFVACVTVPAGEYNDLQIVCGSSMKKIPGTMQLEGGHVYSIALNGKLSMPVASPAAGAVARGSMVTLTSQEGADIYYTLDGSTPDESSAKYSEGIEISGKCTIKAIAMKDGWPTSDVLSASYSIAAAPKPQISVSADGTVTITSEVEDAETHYTLDGKSPNASSPTYDPSNKPVISGENITIFAIAISPRYEGPL